MSSGAVITLEASRALPTIHKAALFEPPFYPAIRTDLIARFNDQIDRGRLAAALITTTEIVKLGPPVLSLTPRPLLELVVRGLFRVERMKDPGGYALVQELLPAMRFDFNVVAEMNRKAESFDTVAAEILLLGGSRSRTYLKEALVVLSAFFHESEEPNSRVSIILRPGTSIEWDAQRSSPNLYATSSAARIDGG